MMRTAMRRLVLAMALTLVAGTTERAEAGLISYTVTATGSGSLGGTSFTDALITITGTADTGDVSEVNAGIFAVVTSTVLSVTGFSTTTFTDVIQVVSNQIDTLAGFGDVTNNYFVLGSTNAAYAGYDLTTEIGPLAGSVVHNYVASFGTAAGDFVINSTGRSATFQATMQTSAVPEPSSLALCGFASLAGLGAWARRRRSA